MAAGDLKWQSYIRRDSFERVTELNFQGLDPSGSWRPPGEAKVDYNFYAWYTLGNASSREIFTSDTSSTFTTHVILAREERAIEPERGAA